MLDYGRPFVWRQVTYIRFEDLSGHVLDENEPEEKIVWHPEALPFRAQVQEMARRPAETFRGFCFLSALATVLVLAALTELPVYVPVPWRSNWNVAVGLLVLAAGLGTGSIVYLWERLKARALLTEVIKRHPAFLKALQETEDYRLLDEIKKMTGR
ncbi:MAG: hypothetical protein WD200_03685 [Candidatus Andersenbacteria bacterium]